MPTPLLAQESVLPDEAALTADFIAFLKAASARRYPTGTVRRFNQARHAGCVQGDFTVRDMAGMIEGNEVKLRSVERRPGASVTFIFSGTVSGDTMSGPIHMGEYLNAKFTAKRHSYPTERTRIVVPKGPPLSS